MTENIRITDAEMRSVFFRILVNYGYAEPKATMIADIFTVNSLEGIYTHGVNRFPRFIRNTRDGFIDPDAEPSVVHVSGSLEQWNGNLGPGPLNAVAATDRAVEIAGNHGLGLVAMANTNHWMRGGYYGWRAAGKGMVFIGWTNTIANMPAWGAKDPRLGNNPFVIAVPYGSDAIVLDFAMSLYSYGKMESYANAGRKLPYPGGFDSAGNLTDDPSLILESWRTLPIGYWKGASLSLLLDILAAILSGGSSVNKITERKTEYALSQVFIAIDVNRLHNSPVIKDTVRDIIDNLHGSTTAEPGTVVRYPGENVHKIKEDSLKHGIPVARNIWDEILSL